MTQGDKETSGKEISFPRRTLLKGAAATTVLSTMDNLTHR